MYCSYCLWLNQTCCNLKAKVTAFFCPNVRLGKLTVHCLMWLFRDSIPCCGISGTARCCGHGKVRAWVIPRCSCDMTPKWKINMAWYLLFIIHQYVHTQFQNNHENLSGQKQTSRTACFGHAYLSCSSPGSEPVSAISFLVNQSYSVVPLFCYSALYSIPLLSVG